MTVEILLPGYGQKIICPACGADLSAALWSERRRDRPTAMPHDLLGSCVSART